jgi:hypothetical protein
MFYRLRLGETRRPKDVRQQAARHSRGTPVRMSALSKFAVADMKVFVSLAARRVFPSEQ